MKVRKDKVARTKDSNSGATSQATGSTGRNEKNSTEQETNVARVSASTGVAQPILVCKEDINQIGIQAYVENGNMVFVCSGETCHIESILLRNILRCFGDYKIVNEIDYYEENELGFETNLPYSLYDEGFKNAYDAWKREQSNQR